GPFPVERRGIEPRSARCDRAVIPLDHRPRESGNCRGSWAGVNASRSGVCGIIGFMADDALQKHRQAIDDYDRQIVQLLNGRAKEVIAIGKLKAEHALPIYAPHREKAVLDKIRKLNTGPLQDRCLEAVYRELMSGSFALEKPLRIGYL